jgi:hypothetical protein
MYIGMYLTFQALLLCFFLAQMANGQEIFARENYAPIGGSFQPLALRLAETGQHHPGGAYYDNPVLWAASRYLFIKTGQSLPWMWTSGKTHQNRLM